MLATKMVGRARASKGDLGFNLARFHPVRARRRLERLGADAHEEVKENRTDDGLRTIEVATR